MGLRIWIDILCLVLGFSAFALVGRMVIQNGLAGTRTKLYAKVSSVVVMVGTIGGAIITEGPQFIMDNAASLPAIGLTADQITAIVLGAKAADWINHVRLRDLTRGPPAT